MEYYVRGEKMSYRDVQQHGQISNAGSQRQGLDTQNAAAWT